MYWHWVYDPFVHGPVYSFHPYPHYDPNYGYSYNYYYY